MKNPYQRQQILSIVQKLAAEILGFEQDEVRADSALGEELGADSLSFVELNHSLEKQFGIKLPKKGILEYAAQQIGSESLFISPSGGLTETGVQLLEQSFFQFAPGQITPAMKRYAILDITTPGNWADMCYHILNQLPDQCPECGHPTAAIAPSGVIVCHDCGINIQPPTGDEILAAYVMSLLPQRHLVEDECAVS